MANETPNTQPAAEPANVEQAAVPEQTLETSAPEVVETGPAVQAPPIKTDAENDADAIAAFDKGVEEADGKPAARDAADIAADAATAAAAALAGVPDISKQPQGDKPVAPLPGVPGPTPEDIAEVKQLNLKGKAAERFQEMAVAIREFAPLREVMAKYKMTDPKQVETVFQDAARGIEWEQAVLESTATPEQFGSALNVIRAMNSDDPKMVSLAYDAMMQTMQDVGKRIGRADLPGDADPLDAHPDLRDEVEEGDITRKRALEIIGQRAALALREEHATKVNQTQTQTREYDQAIASVDALSNLLKTQDPQFMQKLAVLQPTLAVIKANVPPSQWAITIQRAYEQLPAMTPVAAAAPVPRVGAMPRRPAGNGAVASTLHAKPTTDLEAFEIGLASVQQ